MAPFLEKPSVAPSTKATSSPSQQKGSSQAKPARHNDLRSGVGIPNLPTPTLILSSTSKAHSLQEGSSLSPIASPSWKTWREPSIARSPSPLEPAPIPACMPSLCLRDNDNQPKEAPLKRLHSPPTPARRNDFHKGVETPNLPTPAGKRGLMSGSKIILVNLIPLFHY